MNVPFLLFFESLLMPKYLLITCLLIAVFAYGCRPKKNSPSLKTSPSTEVLRINFQDGDLPSLHPHVGIDFRIRSLQSALFECLTRVNPEGIPEPAAAERITISPCGKIYTFFMRPSQWSNGEKLTAFHFENAWKQALTPGSLCLRPDLFYPIKNALKVKKGEMPLDDVGIRSLDENTLQIELENPAPYFLDLVANPMFSPLCEDKEEPTSFNGLFLISSWKKEERITLIPNPSYWDVDHVQLKQIDISIVKDSNTALALFEKGELDWIGSPFSSIPFEAIPSYVSKGLMQSKEVARVFWLYCNTNEGPLQSANIRKALAFAINRQEITEHVLQGQLPTPSPLPNSLNLLDSALLPLQGSVEIAKGFFEEGLKELGLTKESFPPLVLSHSHISGQKQLAEAIQSDWSKILGIPVEIKGSEWNVFFSDLGKGNFQIGGCLKSAFFKDSLYHLELLKDKTHVYNVSRWEDPHYQQLLSDAVKTVEGGLRRELLKKAEAILMEQMPVIPIYSEQYQYILHPSVQGVFVHELGHVDFKWISKIDNK